MTIESLFHKLLEANTSKEITNILEILTDEHNISWRPVGDRENNQSTINMGTDPASGLVERITNSIDSILDLEWHRVGNPADIISPRVAVDRWFKIKSGKLRTINDANDKTIQDLAKKIKVTLKDSEKEDYPTVEIRDFGTGIKGDEFGKTILSLNDNNKINKLHQMGAYGQGGSTSLSFNNFTIIISRPNSILEKGSDTAFTIVRFNDGDIEEKKMGWYEYCVNATTRQPIEVSVNETEFPSGTMVKHIGMDLGKYTAKMTGPTSSLWYLCHHYMFDSILPFTISGQRKKDLNKGKIENRTVFGNNRRLTRGGGEDKNLTQYQRDATLTFRDGKVTVYYWVLTIEGDNPWERIKNYTLQSEPIIITFNGQRQGSLSNAIIKTDLKLPFIEKYLVVQIECDQLDNESKRQLFSSTRENTRDTSIKKELCQLVIDTLSADDELKRLDRERKERYLKKDNTEVIDRLRKRLASKINSYLSANGKEGSVRSTSTKDSVNKKKLPPIPVSDPPTFLEITTPNEKEVFIGKSFGVKFKTDAHPNLFTNPDWFLAVIEPHSFGSYSGSARVVDGYGIAYFKMRDDVEPGIPGEVTLELRPPRQKTISGNVKVIATNLPEDANPQSGGNKNTPNIEVFPISESDPYYIENGWTTLTVADVIDSQDSIAIYINDSNKHIVKLIERAQQYNTKTVDSIKNRYREHIAFCAFMINRSNIKDRLGKECENESLPSDNQIELIRKVDLENSCESICGMLSDFFDYLRTETDTE